MIDGSGAKRSVITDWDNRIEWGGNIINNFLSMEIMFFT